MCPKVLPLSASESQAKPKALNARYTVALTALYSWIYIDCFSVLPLLKIGRFHWQWQAHPAVLTCVLKTIIATPDYNSSIYFLSTMYNKLCRCFNACCSCYNRLKKKAVSFTWLLRLSTVHGKNTAASVYCMSTKLPRATFTQTVPCMALSYWDTFGVLPTTLLNSLPGIFH